MKIWTQWMVQYQKIGFSIEKHNYIFPNGWFLSKLLQWHQGYVTWHLELLKFMDPKYSGGIWCLKNSLFKMWPVAILDLGLRYHLRWDVNKYLRVFTWLETHWLNLGKKLLSHLHFENRSVQVAAVKNVFLHVILSIKYN